MLPNLAIMQIILPLAGGLSCFLLPKRFSWAFASLIMGLTTLIAFLLFKETINSDPILYNLGGWSSSIGIEYKVDKLNSFFMLLVSSACLFNMLAMKDLIKEELNPDKIHLFLGLFLIAITGLLGVCISNDIFNIYVLLEVNAIASYALVAAGKKTKSTKAAFEYLIFGTIGSTLILFGIGFIYSLIGSLNLTIISHAIPNLLDNNATLAGIALIIFGVLMKAALFPLSSWLVNIYQNAPSFVSAMLASTSNKVGLYLLLRFFFDAFQLHQHNFAYLDIILLSFAIFAIFSCAILALRQTNIMRFLAYSSLSQIGFIILSLSLASQLAISGALIYSFTHALEKTALFLAIGYLIAYARPTEELESFAGIAKKHLWLSILIIINLLSSVGVPLTAGFVGKWQILKAALSTDIWYILITSLAVIFTFSYAFKLVELLIFLRKDQEEIEDSPLLGSRFCLWIVTLVTILNLYVGMNHQYLLDIANKISQIVVQ